MRTLIILSLVSFVFLFSSLSAQAGKIRNLNINATDGAKIQVHNSKNSTIDKTTVNKDSKSTVIIDENEVNCDEADAKKGICNPNSY